MQLRKHGMKLKIKIAVGEVQDCVEIDIPEEELLTLVDQGGSDSDVLWERYFKPAITDLVRAQIVTTQKTTWRRK